MRQGVQINIVLTKIHLFFRCGIYGISITRHFNHSIHKASVQPSRQEWWSGIWREHGGVLCSCSGDVPLLLELTLSQGKHCTIFFILNGTKRVYSHTTDTTYSSISGSIYLRLKVGDQAFLQSRDNGTFIKAGGAPLAESWSDTNQWYYGI